MKAPHRPVQSTGVPESQDIEWKRSWHDDYLKWVCGFANARGGRIHIGKDDSGRVVGLANAEKLLEELPNKIRDHLGLMPQINLHHEDGKSYLEIVVDPSSVPISLRGSYYWRSESTKQELKGHALTDFLFKKMGMTWDRVIEDKASLDDIDGTAIDIFRKDAAKAGRLPELGELSIKTGNQKRILRIIGQNPKASAKQLAKALSISQRKVEENLRKLKTKLLLRRIGSAKGGHWEVPDD